MAESWEKIVQMLQLITQRGTSIARGEYKRGGELNRRKKARHNYSSGSFIARPRFTTGRDRQGRSTAVCAVRRRSCLTTVVCELTASSFVFGMYSTFKDQYGNEHCARKKKKAALSAATATEQKKPSSAAALSCEG